MYNLVRGEFYKVFKSKVTYIVGALILLSVIAQLAVVAIYGAIDGGTQFLYGEDTVMGIKCFLASMSGDMMYIFIGVYVAILIYIEYSTRSMGQIVSKGYSKTQVVLSKYIVTTVINICMIGIYAILILVGTSIIGEVGDAQGLGLYIIAFIVGNIIMIISYGGLATLFAYYFKGSMMGVVFNLVFLFVGGVGLQLVDAIIYNITFAQEKESVYNKLYQYWLPCMSATFGDIDTTLSTQYMFMGIFIIIGIISVVGTLSLVNKRDID